MGRGGAAAAWTPLLLGARCDDYYDAAEVLIVTGVSQITGLKNAGHVLQAVGAAQPAYNATGSPNGHPAVLFDGVNHVMQTGALTWNQPCMLIMAAKWTNNLGATQYVCDGRGGNDTFDIVLSGGNMVSYSGAILTFNPQPVSGTAAVFEYLANGASSANALNGAARVTGNGGASNPSGWTLGAIANTTVKAQLAFYRAIRMNADFIDAAERANAIAWCQAGI